MRLFAAGGIVEGRKRALSFTSCEEMILDPPAPIVAPDPTLFPAGGGSPNGDSSDGSQSEDSAPAAEAALPVPLPGAEGGAPQHAHSPSPPAPHTSGGSSSSPLPSGGVVALPAAVASSADAAARRMREIQEEDAQKLAERVEPGETAARARLVAASDKKTWHNEAEGVLGCEHYQRRCKLFAKDINAFVTCRLCYNDALPSMPELDRFKVDRILCMLCKQDQPVSKYCINSACDASKGEGFGLYFCETCRLFDSSGVDVYHCGKCGLCRLGKKEDNYHCDTCHACVSVESRDRHHCMERSLHADCPVCKEYLFTSRSPVIYMRCGHTMHSSCWELYTRSKYTCPVCQKSLTSMSAYYQEIDRIMRVELAHMPEEYRGRRNRILCQDCGQQSDAPFHFDYHRCDQKLENGEDCGSYNTRVINEISP